MDFNNVHAITEPFMLTKTMHRDMYPLLEPSNPELSAKGKKVIVTGASGGVGWAIGVAWATAGADAVVLVGRSEAKLAAAAEKAKAAAQGPVKIVTKTADLTSSESVAALYASLAKEVGTIDVLVNNAGHMNYEKTGEIDPAVWWNDFEVNVKGPYNMIHHFLAQGGGKGTVVDIGSSASGGLFPLMNSYSTAKLAMSKMTEYFDAEHPDLRVFTLLPGLLKTDMCAPAVLHMALDDPMLTGGMTLFLSTPRAEWLRGQTTSVNWDIEEMEAHKDEILSKQLLKHAYLNAKLGKEGHPWET